jgi:uncharacterized protein YdiU (UPF0061 family)
MVIPFDNTYARLPERFYARTKPTAVPQPRLLRLNRPLAALLRLDAELLASEAGVAMLAGNAIPGGAEPIALAYAGHQFGAFVPQLGDGRAILLGEIVGEDGKRRDIQLKGSGPTPFSRRGDGRAALGPVLREYVVSEAMAALGIPTTRALAAVTTGEPVYRERALPGAVLARVASSHMRVGTFQYFAVRGDMDALRTLTEHALARHYPQALSAPNRALALLEQVIDAQASLVARWLGVGFVHGVMNTDNTSISGETIDYGPCAFLDEYDPQKKFSSIDHGGRYAFMNQPRIAQWNLARLAETLLPLVADDEEESVGLVTERLEAFSGRFAAAFAAVLRGKLGLATEQPGDLELGTDLLSRLASSGVDFTLFFRQLCDVARSPDAAKACAALFDDQGAFHEWAERWHARLASEAAAPEARAEAMRRHNPALVPRNHRVEEAIDAATRDGDLGPFETLVEALAHPYDDQPAFAHLAAPPEPHERVLETFCGT